MLKYFLNILLKVLLYNPLDTLLHFNTLEFAKKKAYKSISLLIYHMEPKTLKQIQDIILDQAKTKGFGTKPEDINVGEKIALIHSEVSEAYEAYRHKNIDGKDGFKEELGDVIQRVLHLCGIFDIDIEKEIQKKIDINNDRVWNWEEMNEKHD